MLGIPKASRMIRLMKQPLPMLPKSPNLQHNPSLTATSQHGQSGKRREKRNRQRQPLGMLGIPKGSSTNLNSVGGDSPGEVGPSDAPKEPEPGAQVQPNWDEPTRPIRKNKKQQKKKPAKTTSGNTEDPKSVENHSPDEIGPSNTPKEPEPQVETEVIKGTGKLKPRRPRFDPAKDPYIRFYDLESGVLDFAKVGRSYGIPDMYKDVDHERVNHVEELLSKLESSAAIIYHKIKTVHESGNSNFSITRKERNILRKFLFVMRYRSHKFWSKYTRTIDTYESSDRSRLIEFMKERSITDPRQVWLLNLEVIVRTEIDVDREWLQTIGREMFGDDAGMYLLHMSESYMAFCEPQSSEDEFILTDNGFGIFEGPVVYDTPNLKSTGADGSPPRLGDPRYTEFHKLAPLSPRLILVLRSNFLRDEPIWKRKREISRQFDAQPGAVSLLQDLPIKPPKKHYWLPGKSKPVYTLEDEFFFEIYKVKTEQIHVINGLMLQESVRSITWVSDESLVRSLQAFLRNPDFTIGISLPLLPEVRSFIALRLQKERLLSLWDKRYPTEGKKPLEEFNKMREDMGNNKNFQLYCKLGGEPELFRYDSNQATLLIQFRSLINDHCGLEDSWWSKVHRATIKFMSTFHPRIVWFHVKMWKVAANRNRRGLGDSPVTEADYDILAESGPEDVIANLVDFLPFSLLSRLMLETSWKGIHKLNGREKLTTQRVSGEKLETTMVCLDMNLMSEFGCLVGTPYHFEPVDFCDPFRPDIPDDLLKKFYAKDLGLRLDLRGKIEKVILGTRGTPEMYKWLSQLLWDHLYPIPAQLLN
ncbi:hypothetical protein B9Z19DRAFT_1075273 [Tuber borchii]|uniref:Uncharacterized protein n=1 Tax=Tuber borchii TaxID=42251 RepID=A0A2T7A3F1_TUBBO|nr:hypothetical protein B9Z19DRAFT_1075273 [Tuber borchii]